MIVRRADVADVAVLAELRDIGRDGLQDRGDQSSVLVDPKP